MDIFQHIAFIFVLYFVFGLFEKHNPVERDQSRNWRWRNVFITLIFLIFGGASTVILTRFFPWPSLGKPYSIIFTGLMVFAAIFLWDLLFYWYHRAEHAFGWLWSIHQLHHSDQHLNATSSLRHTWIESPMEAIFITLPTFSIMQLDALGMLGFSVLTTMWLFFLHANWRLHLGPFTSLIGGPQNHRIHHSSLAHHRDKNFAVYFPIIDRMFGTYYSPAPDEFPSTGTEGMNSHASWRAVLARPFLAWFGVDEM